MTDEDRRRIREEINAQPLTNFYTLQRSKGANMYVCPECKSGTGKNQSGAFSITHKGSKYIHTCFACHRIDGQDTLGALRILWHCSESEAFEKCGYTPDRIPTERLAPAPKLEEPEKVYDFTEFIKKSHADLMASPEGLQYLEKRGISKETAEHFNFGYCATWTHPKTNKYPSKRLIIPSSNYSYLARRIESKGDGYDKQKAGNGKELFNVNALKSSKVVFVCEGEIDAASFYEVGAEAIGIRSIGNCRNMLEAAKNHPDIFYLIALDNDTPKEDGSNPGADTQRKLCEAMKEAGINAISCNGSKLYNGAKDPNEALTTNRAQFADIVKKAVNAANEKRMKLEEEQAAELKKRTGAGMLDTFLEEIRTEKYKPIPTGISNLDKALEGGLMRKTLVTLGAAPGMGKTAIAQWILENMAKYGHDVLYINLEMDRSQLIARSIARTAYKYPRYEREPADVSAIQILRGYEWTEEQREAIQDALNKYREWIAPHFIYNPEGVTNSLDSILKACKDEANRLKTEGKPAPIVCIDYLQLIDFDILGEGERKPEAVEGLKRSISEIKRFALEYDTTVLLIIAHNRASNKEGRATMESGRDTSTIEYTGDLMLGLSYTAIEDNEQYKYGEDKNGNSQYKPVDMDHIQFKIDEADRNGKPRPDIANRLCLKILKSRFSEPGKKARFIFDGRHSTFTEVVNIPE